MTVFAFTIDGAPRTIWVAPKQRPVLDANGEITLDQDGNTVMEEWIDREGAFANHDIPLDTPYETLADEAVDDWQAAHRLPEDVIAEYEQKVQDSLDAFAQSHGYDNMNTLCSYALSTNEKWAKEGQYGVVAKDKTWEKAQEIMNAALQAGTVPTWQEVESQLPLLVWPA